jgi:hypothetical protein
MKYGTHSATQSTNAIATAVVQKSMAQLLPLLHFNATPGPGRELVLGGSTV